MKLKLKIVFYFMLLGIFSINAQETKEDIEKQAKSHFKNEEFLQATPLFLRLVSLEPRNPNYNYKYGTCLLYNANKNSEAFKHLNYAVQKDNEVDPEAYYYLGKAFHLTYRFDSAIKNYKEYKKRAGTRTIEKLNVDRQIEMCKNGKSLFTDITETIVLEKQKIGIESFFRIYDLNDIGGILIVTEEFQSRQDKKNNHTPLIHFPADSDYIYYSSYGASSENKDIYFRFRKSDGSWSDESPVLGEVNSQYDEDYPYMHPSGEYLYFSSNGHKSIGGYDVFRSKYDPSNQSFGRPENMNISISSPDNDFLYIVDSLDRHAYFASQRESELDKVHVYKLRVERLPMELIVLKGDFNSNINPNQKEISIKVKDLQGDVLGNYSSNKRGEYTIQLPRHGSYEFIVAVKGKENLHSEIVEIPKLDQFRPLKQQITEIDKNGENEIVFKNEFDKLFANQYEILAEAIENKAKMDINKGQFDLDSLDRAKKEKQKLEKFGLSAYTTIELKDLIETKYEDLALRQSSTDSLIQKSKNTLQAGNAKLLAAISSADSLTKLSKQNPNSSKVEEWKDLARKESRRSKQIEEDMTNAEIILSFLEEDLEENKANFKEAQSLQNEVKNLSNDEENAIISAMVRHEVFVKNELKERTRTNAYFEYLAHINEELRRRDLLVGKRDSLQNEQTQTKNKIQQLEKQYAEASKRAQKDLSFEKSRAQILLEGIDNEIAYLDGVIEEKSKVANQKAVLADISKDSEAENTISSETLAEQLNTAKEQLSSIEEEIEVLNEPSEESEELAENQSKNEVESETQSEDIIAEHSSNNQEEKSIEKEEPIEDKSKEESIAEERNKASEENTQTESSEDIAVEEEPLEEEPLIVPTLSDVDPNYEDEYKNLEKAVDFREKDKSVLVQRKKEAKLKVEKALLNAENELQESPNEEQLIANHTALKELNKKLEYEIEALELEILKDEMFAHNTGNHRSQNENENESEEETSTLAENNSSETQNEENLEVKNETQSENENESKEETSTLAENNSSETQNQENLEVQNETQSENENESKENTSTLAENNSSETQNQENLEVMNETQSENESESKEETSTLAENNSSDTQNEDNLEVQNETQSENESESEENTSTLAENKSSETQNQENLEVQNETQSENESVVQREEDIAVTESYSPAEELINDVDDGYLADVKGIENDILDGKKTQRNIIQRKYQAVLKVQDEQDVILDQLAEDPENEALKTKIDLLYEAENQIYNEIEFIEDRIAEEKDYLALHTSNKNNSSETQNEENLETQSETQNENENENEVQSEDLVENQSENESESKEETSNLAENKSSETQNEENLETQSETQKENESEVQSEDLVENQSKNESESKEETSTLAENKSSETQNEENLETQSETQKENESEVQSEDLAENQSESKSESELTLNKEVDKVFDIEEASIQLLTEIDPSYLDDISELEKAVEAGNKSTQDLIKRKYKVLIKVGDVKTVATQEAKNNPSEEIEEEIELLTIVEDQISTEIKILENELIFAQSNEDAQEKTELQNLSTITRSSVPQELSRKLMREDREYLSELFDQKEDLIRQLNNDPSLVEDKKFKKQLVRNKDEIAYYMNTVLNYSILENFPDLEDNTEKLSNNNPEEVTALQSKQSLIKINALTKEAESTKDAEDLYKVLKSAYDEQEKAKARIQNHKKQKRINSYIAQLKKNSDLENINEETVASTIEDIEQDQKELSQQLIELNDQINSLNSKMVKAKKKEIKFLEESIRELEEIQMGVQNKYYENNTIIEEHNAERKKENNKGVDDEAIKNTLTYKEEVEIAQSQDYIAQLKNSNRLTQLQYELNIKQTQLDNRKNELNNLYMEIKEQPRFTKENKKELEEKLKEISASKVEIDALRQNIFEQQDLVASNLPDNIILRNKVENLIARDVAPIKEAPIRRRVQTGLTITENPEEAKIAYSDDNPIPVIEKQDEQLGGLIFRVQIGAFRNPVPNETFGAFSPITGDKVGSGWIKYVVGLFADRDNAAEARDKIRTMGYSDAFVVAYCDGERIPVYRAIELMNSGACVPIIESDEDLIAEAQTEDEENKVEEGSTLRTKPQTQIDEYAYNKAKNAAKADVVESKDGLFYTVQVGVYNTPVTQEQLFNIDPLITKRLPNGQIRYSSGVFNSVEEAQPQKEMAIDKGVKDAYIVAYFKGKRISVAEARNIVEQKGDEILELKNPTPVYKTKDLVVENSEIEEINSEEGEKLDPFIKDYNVQKVFVSKERYKEYPSQVLNALNNSGDLFYFDQKSKRIKSFLKGNNEELSALNEMDFDEVLMFKGAYKVLDKKTPYKKKALQYSDADLIQLNVNIEKQKINSDLMEAILHASTSKEIISQNDEISVQFYALDNEQEREDMDKLYALLSKLGATNIEKIIISN